MGANVGKPNDVEQQTAIVKEALEWLVKIDSAGKIVPLAYEYKASI